MFRRYHHGHSILLGAACTLLLERHMALFALLIFVAGIVVGRTWLIWLRVGEAARRYFRRQTVPRIRAMNRTARREAADVLGDEPFDSWVRRQPRP